jgi:predicted dehydrogenase
MEGIYKHVAATNIEIVAVCDPWRIAREQANGKVRKWFGRDARQFVSYRDLLAMEGIDAVMIASPDHVHTIHLEAAAKAGKHIYIEKHYCPTKILKRGVLP